MAGRNSVRRVRASERGPRSGRRSFVWCAPRLWTACLVAGLGASAGAWGCRQEATPPESGPDVPARSEAQPAGGREPAPRETPEGGSPAEAAPQGAAPAYPFEEVAEESGLRFVLRSGASGRYFFPEINCGGVAIFDFDNDGWMDVFLTQAGSLLRPRKPEEAHGLFRNVGGGRFEPVPGAGGAMGTNYANGVAIGDYDNDGWADIYVTNVGANALYRNNGDGTFTDVTEQAGVGDPGWSTSAAFFDYDADGWLDLFVTNYIRWSVETERPCFSPGGVRDYCGPNSYAAPAPDTLYHNNGDGTFSDVSREAGLRSGFGNGLGVVCGDFDNDGDQDIYVANDQMPNQLWINNGDGTFTDQAVMLGAAVNEMGDFEASMGIACEDLDHDGDLDLFMVHLAGETNTLYVNHGGYFEDVTVRTGLGGTSRPYTGFGMGFFDYDHDGWWDLFIGNGRVAVKPRFHAGEDPYAERNQLYRGTGPLRWEEVTRQAGPAFALEETTRGAAFGDLDNDGDVDIVAINRDAPARYYRNVAPKRGTWVGVRVLEANGRDAIGAHVRLRIGEQVRQRDVRAAYSYQSSNDPRVHFGLGSARAVDEVEVQWTDGTVESFGSIQPGQYYLLRRGTGQAQPLKFAAH